MVDESPVGAIFCGPAGSHLSVHLIDAGLPAGIRVNGAAVGEPEAVFQVPISTGFDPVEGFTRDSAGAVSRVLPVFRAVELRVVPKLKICCL